MENDTNSQETYVRPFALKEYIDGFYSIKTYFGISSSQCCW